MKSWLLEERKKKTRNGYIHMALTIDQAGLGIGVQSIKKCYQVDE